MVHLRVDHMSKPREKTVGVTEFKAKCLGLVNEIEKGRTKRVVLTKRGKPVAELTAARPALRTKPQSTFGALKDIMTLDPSVDLTKPSGLEWDAEKGILYNE
jgi:antitoxin (DNA-binding transcriptional repressor) of toxin-antitoxin stability system